MLPNRHPPSHRGTACALSRHPISALALLLWVIALLGAIAPAGAQPRRALVFGPATVLGTGSGSDILRHAGFPQVAAGDHGEAVAVWTSGTGIQTASRPAHGAWSAPTALSTADVLPGYAQIGLSDKGEAIAVWASISGVHAASRPARGTWSPPATIGAGDQSQLAVNGNGEAVAVWVTVTGRNIVVEAASRQAEGAWSAPTAISAPTPIMAPDILVWQPQVALADNGKAVAIWNRQVPGGGDVVETASRSASGAWSAATVLGTNHSLGAQVAIDRNGDAVAVWEDLIASSRMIRTASRPAKGAWSMPTVLGEGARADVAVNGKGEAIAVWNSSIPGGGGVVEAASRRAREPWSTPTILSADDVPFGRPQVALSAKGQAVVVWQRPDAIEAVSRPARGAWSSPSILSGGGIVFNPQVAVADTGEAVAIWGHDTVVEASVTE